MKYLITIVLMVVLGAVAGCTAPQTKQAQADGQIQWQTDLTAAMAQAKAAGKTVIVDFWATWCGPCKMMEEQTWPNADVVAAAANFITVKQDVDKFRAVAQKYNISGVPTVLFLSPDGTIKHRQVGFMPPAEMTKLMKSQK